MKVLTVCEQGLNRSVTAKYLVQRRGHEVIAAGTANLSAPTLAMLGEWADRIILLDRTLHDTVFDANKLLVWHVGADTYEHHYNPELVARLRQCDAVTPWP